MNHAHTNGIAGYHQVPQHKLGFVCVEGVKGASPLVDPRLWVSPAPQGAWRRRQERKAFKQQRDKVATERLGVLFDLWDQGGAPLADRRKRFQRIQDVGLGSLRSLVLIRTTLLQAARQLPVRSPRSGRFPSK